MKSKQPAIWQSMVYDAYVALGFKCSDCGATRDLLAIHKEGKEAHRALARQLGWQWLRYIASSAKIRELYKLVCKPCFFRSHASVSKLGDMQSRPLASGTSKPA